MCCTSCIPSIGTTAPMAPTVASTVERTRHIAACRRRQRAPSKTACQPKTNSSCYWWRSRVVRVIRITTPGWRRSFWAARRNPAEENHKGAKRNRQKAKKQSMRRLTDYTVGVVVCRELMDRSVINPEWPSVCCANRAAELQPLYCVGCRPQSQRHGEEHLTQQCERRHRGDNTSPAWRGWQF
jgi:hypothetical protein